MWAWLADPNRAASVGAAGLLVSLIGFAVAIWQITITKKAAQSAAEAALGAKIRLNSFSALRECEAAKLQFDRIIEAIKGQQWSQIIDISQNLSTSLVNLVESNAGLDKNVTSYIIEANVTLIRNCGVLERALTADPLKITKAKQFTAFSTHQQCFNDGIL